MRFGWQNNEYSAVRKGFETAEWVGAYILCMFGDLVMMVIILFLQLMDICFKKNVIRKRTNFKFLVM